MCCGFEEVNYMGDFCKTKIYLNSFKVNLAGIITNTQKMLSKKAMKNKTYNMDIVTTTIVILY